MDLQGYPEIDLPSVELLKYSTWIYIGSSTRAQAQVLAYMHVKIFYIPEQAVGIGFLWAWYELKWKISLFGPNSVVNIKKDTIS